MVGWTTACGYLENAEFWGTAAVGFIITHIYARGLFACFVIEKNIYGKDMTRWIFSRRNVILVYTNDP